MDYRLSVFQAVAECLSFTKASKALCISQPAVTQHVKVLEDQIGRPLFTRSTHGISLTEAGMLLLKHSQVVVHLEEDVIQKIRGKEGSITGQLDIGVTSTIDQYLLPAWLVQSRRLWPQLQLNITTGNSERIITEVRDGKLQLGLIEGMAEKRGLRTEYFYDDEIICVAAAKHSLARGKSISPERLTEYALIFRERGCHTRDYVEAALKRFGIEPRRLKLDLVLNSNESIKNVVIAGHGLTFLSTFAVKQEIALGRLRRIPVRGLEIIRRFQLIYPRGARPGGAAGAFIQLVLNANGQAGTAGALSITSDYNI
jgi:DNA-binding transcriptional LysR family regulator